MNLDDLSNMDISKAIHHEDLLGLPGNHGQFPKAHATLTIDLRLMTAEQRDRVDQAVHLLYDAGVTFDRGVGFGGYDIELDDSLVGATLHVRPLWCKHCATKGFNPAFWTTYDYGDGRIYPRAYCSPECRTAGDAAHIGKVLAHETAPAWSVPE